MNHWRKLTGSGLPSPRSVDWPAPVDGAPPSRTHSQRLREMLQGLRRPKSNGSLRTSDTSASKSVDMRQVPVLPKVSSTPHTIARKPSPSAHAEPLPTSRNGPKAAGESAHGQRPKSANPPGVSAIPAVERSSAPTQEELSHERLELRDDQAPPGAFPITKRLRVSQASPGSGGRVVGSYRHKRAERRAQGQVSSIRPVGGGAGRENRKAAVISSTAASAAILKARDSPPNPSATPVPEQPPPAFQTPSRTVRASQFRFQQQKKKKDTANADEIDNGNDSRRKSALDVFNPLPFPPALPLSPLTACTPGSPRGPRPMGQERQSGWADGRPDDAGKMA